MNLVIRLTTYSAVLLSLLSFAAGWLSYSPPYANLASGVLSLEIGIVSIVLIVPATFELVFKKRYANRAAAAVPLVLPICLWLLVKIDLPFKLGALTYISRVESYVDRVACRDLLCSFGGRVTREPNGIVIEFVGAGYPNSSALLKCNSGLNSKTRPANLIRVEPGIGDWVRAQRPRSSVGPWCLAS